MDENVLEEQINQAIKKMNNEFDIIIASFCDNLGYKVNNVYDLLKAQAELEKKGFQIRCEVFYKYDSKHKNIVECKTLTIPFLDNIDNPLTRQEVRQLYCLEDYF